MNEEDVRGAIQREVSKDKLEQIGKMEKVWDSSDEVTRAYLKGCITTACALASEKKIG